MTASGTLVPVSDQDERRPDPSLRAKGPVAWDGCGACGGDAALRRRVEAAYAVPPRSCARSVPKYRRISLRAALSAFSFLADLARPMAPSKAAKMKVAASSQSTSGRIRPRFFPPSSAVAIWRTIPKNRASSLCAEFFVERAHFLGEIVHRTAENCQARAEQADGESEARLDPLQRVLELLKMLAPDQIGKACEKLVDHRQTEIGLAGEIMIEGALGQMGLGEQDIDPQALEAMFVDFRKSDVEQARAGFA